MPRVSIRNPETYKDLPLELVCKTGVVYTFSHDEYPKFEQRKGREQDEQRIKEHFSDNLGYRVVDPFVNLTANEVRSKTKVIATSDDLNDADAIIVFVISQYDVVGKYLAKEDSYTEDEVYQAFIESTSLVHKPKIFIFQASKASPAIYAARRSVVTHDGGGDSVFYTLPEETNLFIVRSSLPFLLENGGTRFIDEICNEFIGRLPLQQEIVHVMNKSKSMRSIGEINPHFTFPPDVTSTLIQTVFLTGTRANTVDHKLVSYDRAKKNGILYIFNYDEAFNNAKHVLEPRKGTEYDVEKMKKTFERLDFDVIVEDNPSARNLKQKLQRSARLEEGKEAFSHMCVIIAVFTHGYEGKLGTTDDLIDCMDLYKEVGLQEDFKDIPKIFILQVCRGESTSLAVEFEGIVEVENEEDKKDSVNFDDYYDVDATPGSIKYIEDEMPKNNPVLKVEDMIVLHSTYQGKAALRSEKHGTWLIQELCAAVNRKTPNYNQASLVDIFTEVQREVALLKFGKNKQMPVYTSTLTKDVIIGKRN